MNAKQIGTYVLMATLGYMVGRFVTGTIENRVGLPAIVKGL